MSDLARFSNTVAKLDDGSIDSHMKRVAGSIGMFAQEMENGVPAGVGTSTHNATFALLNLSAAIRSFYSVDPNAFESAATSTLIVMQTIAHTIGSMSDETVAKVNAFSTAMIDLKNVIGGTGHASTGV